MTLFLKQNTASQELLLGPFVSSTDGITPKTGLSIASTDINIWKTGSTSLTTCSTAASEIGTGNYSVVLAAADTDTLGPMILYVKPSGALIVRLELAVLPANIYDSWFGSDVQDVSVTQWTGTAVHAPGTAGVPLVDIHDAASATIGTVTTLTNLPAVTTDWLTASGVKADAVTKIQTGLATPTNITAGTITTATNVTTVNGIANGAITAAAIADNAIDLATFAADCKTGSALKANVETVTNNAITAAAIATGAIDADAFATDAISAAAVSAAAVTKVQTGLATPTNITAGTITTATNVTTLNGIANDVITAASIATDAFTSDAFAADSIDAAAIKADAVTKIQTGLATPTNITAGTITTATNVTTLNGIANDVITAASIATDAISSDAIAATAVTELQAGLATSAELAKVPKSDSNVSWNTTALAAINAEVDTALNTAIPGAPTADSINERVAAIDTAAASILPFTYRHYKITAPVFDASHNMTSCTITRYPTKADKVADTNGVVYNVVATYDVSGDLATYSEEGAV